MPAKPLRECKHAGCHELTRDGLCQAHALQHQREKDARRDTPAERGYDDTWRKVRLMALKRDHYICQRCGVGGANEVDHIVPISRGGDRLRLDNLQTLCHRCHSKKTATEDGGFGYDTTTRRR
jgi:5-methylcytosine-specific restriction protein A